MRKWLPRLESLVAIRMNARRDDGGAIENIAFIKITQQQQHAGHKSNVTG